MVATCANPLCRTKFRYLHDGKLFSSEPSLVAGGSAEWMTATRPTQYFWLCGTCCRRFTLAFHPVAGLKLIPIANPKALRTRVPLGANGGQRGTKEAA